MSSCCSKQKETALLHQGNRYTFCGIITLQRNYLLFAVHLRSEVMQLGVPLGVQASALTYLLGYSSTVAPQYQVAITGYQGDLIPNHRS